MWWWFVTTAWGCAACACGDPTLSPFGAERPTAGRLRLGVEVGHRSELATLEDRWEDRLSARVGWAPSDRWVLAAAVPVVRRGAAWVDGTRDEGLGLGDPALSARWIAWRDGPAPKNLLAVALTAELPVAPAVRYPDGTVAVDEAQPGREGALSPVVSWTRVDGAASSWVTLGGRWEPERLDGLGAVGVQLQPWIRGGVRAGVDVRAGKTGAAGLLTPGIIWSFAEDWTLTAQAGLHLFHVGPWREGTSGTVGVAVDL